jgi:hypothetical protein
MSVEPALAAVITIAQMSQRYEELIAVKQPQPGIEGMLLAVELLVLEKWLAQYRQTISPEAK